MNKTVLISGGAGYIGSHTAVELINAGYEVVVIDNFSNSDKEIIDRIAQITGRSFIFEQIDVCDKKALAVIFEKYDFNSVIHFAAYKAVGESVADPLKYYNNNLISFINIMELMREYKRENIIFSSSATVYGQTDKLPVTEQTDRQPATSPYGNTKQICEDIMRDSLYAYQSLNGIALRYFNPIGAHSSALIGELPKGVPNNLVPFITQTAANIRSCLNIFGDDYNTPDGTCLRDFIDVTDLAKAHVAAISRLVTKENTLNFEIYNVGTGTPLSVMELINKFEKVNNLKLNYKVVERRQGDIEAVWADTTLANKNLKWRAVRSVEDTLESAWNWQKSLK